MITIRAEDLGKRFGSIWAVRDLSFEENGGKVLGFLGQNGAGKSTTMRLLTGFLNPSEGKAFVDDIDVAEYPLAVRRRIGYLPENNPLPLEMRVTEYLKYRAALKEIPAKKMSQEVAMVLERAELEDQSRQIIGTLSKGYRQRVGLADALLGDPPLLILDEPTVGLDPLQIERIRDLIREQGQHKLVLLSTHILQEVQAVCDQVLIIHQGRSTFMGPMEDLVGDPRLLIRVSEKLDVLKSVVSQISGVTGVAPHPEFPQDGLVLELACDSDPRLDLARACREKDLLPIEMAFETRSLDEAVRRKMEESPFEEAEEEGISEESESDSLLQENVNESPSEEGEENA